MEDINIRESERELKDGGFGDVLSCWGLARGC